MTIRLTPRPLAGTVRAVSSKSHAHRALICAALAGAPLPAGGLDPSEDLAATYRCLAALDGPEPVLDCGESGSTLRFLLPVAAMTADTARFTGRGRLPERPLGPLLEAMAAHGCRFTTDRVPLTVTGRLRGGAYTLPGNVSSQYISGLLLALPLARENSRIRLSSPLESAGYVALTLRTLRDFGVHVEQTQDGFLIPGGQRYTAPPAYTVEGDWSNAAFFLTAGALAGPVRVTGLRRDAGQGDRAIERLLKAFGGRAVWEDEAIALENGAPFAPQRVDVADVPDLFPILAVAACACRGDTLLYNAARLRLKESDRIASTARLLVALGGRAEERPDALLIRGEGALRGGAVDGCGDHRIVMAAAIAAQLCREPVEIHGAEAVCKSYPRFFDDFTALGGQAHVL